MQAEPQGAHWAPAVATATMTRGGSDLVRPGSRQGSNGPVCLSWADSPGVCWCLPWARTCEETAWPTRLVGTWGWGFTAFPSRRAPAAREGGHAFQPRTSNHSASPAGPRWPEWPRAVAGSEQGTEGRGQHSRRNAYILCVTDSLLLDILLSRFSFVSLYVYYIYLCDYIF